MAYRELGMVEVREILRRWRGGEGVPAIARGTTLDRKTLAAYVGAALAVVVQRGGAPPHRRADHHDRRDAAPGAADERDRAQSGS